MKGISRAALSCVTFLVLCAGSAAAQNVGNVTGQVVDAATGRPLIGAQVAVVGTNIGGLTNENGRYLITRVPAGDHQVRVVMIGYGQSVVSVVVPDGGTASADFRISTAAIELEALVVSAATGREQRARELGTKVANIDVAKVSAAKVASVADVLSGRSEGVIMMDVNGTTGTSQRIRIRGANSLSLSNEPLVYVDGALINTIFTGGSVGGQQESRLNDINPNDIESIEIVKGPAASALYGTAAANGVVLIKTKRGAPGNTQWDFFAETGQVKDMTTWPGNYVSYQVLDASQPVLRASDGLFNTAAYKYCPNLDAAQGKCTQDATMFFNTLTDPRTTPFSTGDRQRYGMSVRGGTDQVRYFVSGQTGQEQGVISYNQQHQYNFRANVDAALDPRADLSISFGYTGGLLGLNSNDNSVFSPIINGLVGRPYFVPPSAARPDVPNALNYGWGFNVDDLSNLVTHEDIDRYTTSANMRWRPWSWLAVNGNGGLDVNAQHDYQTLQPGKLPIAESYTKGYRWSQRANQYVYSAILSGVGTFKLRPDLISTSTVGGNYSKENRRSTYCYGSSLVPGTGSCGTTAALFSIDETFYEVRTVGGYAQEELQWRDKVTLSGGLRGDDNSAFGANFGFIWYPSISASWVIGEENWFPQVDWLSNLRLRTAWGRSGLRPNFRDAVTLFNPATVASASGDQSGVTLRSTGNENLKPERVSETEVGFDAGFLEDRLGLTFTYFTKTSNDALISRRLPPSLGLTATVYDNLGSVQNRGTETTVHANVLRKDNVDLSLGFTNTTLSNKVLTLGEGVASITMNRGLQRDSAGYPAGGFFQNSVTYADANGDGLLTLDEVQVGQLAYLGTPLPKWDRSIFMDLTLFKTITVSTLFEGRGGNMTENETESFRCGTRSTYGCSAVGNTNASIDEQAAFLASRYLGSKALYVESANFWKWRELSVAFNVPSSLVRVLPRAQGLRVTVAGRNLATFTNYSGLDPETVEGGGASNFNQSEFNTQPPVRYLTIRLDYHF
jgi:TonB-dependent starch-binding outer membrane protein SusC